MSANYQYIISDDTLNGAVVLDKLKYEINISNISTPLDYLSSDIDGDTLDVWMDEILSGDDANTLHNIIANHDGVVRTILEKKYLVEAYTDNRLATETWYYTDNEDDTYSDKVYETSYAWQDNVLLSKTEKVFYDDGSEQSSKTWNYFTNGDDSITKEA